MYYRYVVCTIKIPKHLKLSLTLSAFYARAGFWLFALQNKDLYVCALHGIIQFFASFFTHKENTKKIYQFPINY